MKRKISILLLVCLLTSLFSIPTFADGDVPTSGACGDNAVWSYDADTATFTVSGTGDMYDNIDFITPWMDYWNLTKTIIIEPGITHIGNYSFSGFCMTSLILPDGLISIGMNAFGGCGFLDSLELPDSVTTLEQYAFDGCYALSELKLSKGLKSIGDTAFRSAGITNLVIPEGVESIERSAFSSCVNLDTISFPESLKTIESNAFSHCESLTELSFPSRLESIGYQCFAYCSALESVTFHSGGIDLANWAFQNCYALASANFMSDAPSSISHGLGSSRTFPMETVIYYVPGTAGWEEHAYETKHGTEWHGYSLLPYGYVDPGFVVPTQPLFTDVKEKDWFFYPVQAAAAAEIVAGKPDGSYAPYEALSWAQTVTFATRVCQYMVDADIYRAEDQHGEHWYDIYVDFCLANGFISGVPENPNATVTRAEASLIFAAVLEAAGYEELNSVPEGYFSDVEDSGRLHDAVYLLARAGICNGKSAGYFGVDETFLRSEVATIVARMCGLVDSAELLK